jgi:hypothetical protein
MDETLSYPHQYLDTHVEEPYPLSENIKYFEFIVAQK